MSKRQVQDGQEEEGPNRGCEIATRATSCLFCTCKVAAANELTLGDPKHVVEVRKV